MSLQQRLVKTGGRLVKHARYYWLLLAEGHLTGACSGTYCGGSGRLCDEDNFVVSWGSRVYKGAIRARQNGNPG